MWCNVPALHATLDRRAAATASRAPATCWQRTAGGAQRRVRAWAGVLPRSRGAAVGAKVVENAMVNAGRNKRVRGVFRSTLMYSSGDERDRIAQATVQVLHAGLAAREHKPGDKQQQTTHNGIRYDTAASAQAMYGPRNHHPTQTRHQHNGIIDWGQHNRTRSTVFIPGVLGAKLEQLLGLFW